MSAWLTTIFEPWLPWIVVALVLLCAVLAAGGLWVRMDKILCAVLREAHGRQIEETMDALEDGPGRFYISYLDD